MEDMKVPVSERGEFAPSSTASSSQSRANVQHRQGEAYEALCRFMQEAERPSGSCGVMCCSQPSVGKSWRDSMTQVENGSGGWVWIKTANEDAYRRKTQRLSLA